MSTYRSWLICIRCVVRWLWTGQLAEGWKSRVAEHVEIKSFELNIEPIPFKLNSRSDDTFYAVPDLPLSMIQSLSKFRNITKSTNEFDESTLLTIFEELLTPAAFELLKMRVKEKTFGVKAMMTVIPWLLEQYGLRPTQPSSPSLTGSGDDGTGTSSTDGALVEVSIPFDSQQLAPST